MTKHLRMRKRERERGAVCVAQLREKALHKHLSAVHALLISLGIFMAEECKGGISSPEHLTFPTF